MEAIGSEFGRQSFGQHDLNFRFLPVRPKRVIQGRSFQQVREFIQVSRPEISTKQMPGDVPCGVTNGVLQIEGGYGNVGDTADRSPQPGLFRSRDIEELHSGIPEAKVEFQIQGHFRIVIVAAPSPAGVSNHGGEVVGSRMGVLRGGVVADVRHRLARCSDVFDGKEEIDIVLRA